MTATDISPPRWRTRMWAGMLEFWWFGLKQAWACLFGGALLALILGTYLFWPSEAAMARYDFLFAGALAIQVALIAFRLETWEEAKIILIFHVVGTVMEVFKTQVGSWTYPEENLIRIAGVPLFSGFMYAAVGSYLARVWRIFDFRFTRHPPLWAIGMLSVAIYANFFLHHFWWDARWVLFAMSGLLWGRCWIHYTPHGMRLRMPLLLGFALVALFIWFAENAGTFAGAWVYPSQAAEWHLVPLSKFGSWFLLMLISYTLVAWVHRPRDESAST